MVSPLTSSPTSLACNLTTPSLTHQWQQQHQIHIPTTPKSTSTQTRRRTLTLSLFPFLLSPLSPSPSSSSPSSTPQQQEEEEKANLEPYADYAVGFTLLIPSSWAKVEKAGATALFEERKGGSGNSIGVVVTPVKLSNLTDFGTPQFVADKLIGAERRKESTKQAEVISFNERLGHNGLPIYEFEYMVDSTRGGMKRIFSSAFVASKNLYLLNISYSDRPDNPLDSQTRMVLEQVLHSFDTAL